MTTFKKITKQEKEDRAKFVAEETKAFVEYMKSRPVLIAGALDYTAFHIKAGLDFYETTVKELDQLFPEQIEKPKE